jgi:polycomb protein EED
LWNIKTSALVAIFGGVEGHRDEVLGVDVHSSGSKIVSCGMDHSLKVWRLDVPEVEQAIRSSFGHKCTEQRRPFKTLSQHFPDYSTRDVHHNYVDCVSWHGGAVVSKSCEHDLKMWRQPETNMEPLIMTEVEVKKKKKSSKDVNIWYLKFGFDFGHAMLAVGDGTCKTHVYNMIVNDPSTISSPSAILSHPKCVSVVRVAAFSYEGDILITTCDDGSVFRWDRIKSE